ncbi:hypothetical protein GA0115233_102247 [Streptomyces sp. DI166]|nr:hypothetical protein GA0115233_102247 [Streptomyces sp. DI166]
MGAGRRHRRLCLRRGHRLRRGVLGPAGRRRGAGQAAPLAHRPRDGTGLGGQQRLADLRPGRHVDRLPDDVPGRLRGDVAAARPRGRRPRAARSRIRPAQAHPPPGPTPYLRRCVRGLVAAHALLLRGGPRRHRSRPGPGRHDRLRGRVGQPDLGPHRPAHRHGHRVPRGGVPLLGRTPVRRGRPRRLLPPTGAGRLRRGRRPRPRRPARHARRRPARLGRPDRRHGPAAGCPGRGLRSGHGVLPAAPLPALDALHLGGERGAHRPRLGLRAAAVHAAHHPDGDRRGGRSRDPEVADDRHGHRDRADRSAAGAALPAGHQGGSWSRSPTPTRRRPEHRGTTCNGRPCRQRSRSAIRSPTRRALAMAVSDGFTAPMLGKKLVSTT